MILFPLLGYLFPKVEIFYIIREGCYQYTFGSQKVEYLKIFGEVLNSLDFLFISIVILFLFRFFFKEKTFNNSGNLYYDFPYLVFYVAGKILNYKKIDLVQVPVWLQYKIVIDNTFNHIDYGVGLKKIEDEHVVETKNNFDETSIKEINLILSDTFEVKFESIPIDKHDLPTITIKRNIEGDKERKYSPEFINKVRNIVVEYNDSCEVINIYSYTNTQHNFLIAKDCFKTGYRNLLKKINIYQPDKKTFTFVKKHVIKF